MTFSSHISFLVCQSIAAQCPFLPPISRNLINIISKLYTCQQLFVVFVYAYIFRHQQICTFHFSCNLFCMDQTVSGWGRKTVNGNRTEQFKQHRQYEEYMNQHKKTRQFDKTEIQEMKTITFWALVISTAPAISYWLIADVFCPSSASKYL